MHVLGNSTCQIPPTLLSEGICNCIMCYTMKVLFVSICFLSMLRHKKRNAILRSLLELHGSVTSSIKHACAWWVSTTSSLASLAYWPELLLLLIYWPTNYLQQ